MQQMSAEFSRTLEELVQKAKLHRVDVDDIAPCTIKCIAENFGVSVEVVNEHLAEMSA